MVQKLLFRLRQRNDLKSLRYQGYSNGRVSVVGGRASETAMINYETALSDTRPPKNDTRPTHISNSELTESSSWMRLMA
jgi:hypothetical protein